MSTTESVTRHTGEEDQAGQGPERPDVAEVEVLVEEISIDGMCGVY